MTPSEYIDKAIHAINTDQPNLAMLYMSRGMTEIDQIRRQRRMDMVISHLDLLVEAFADFGRSLVKVTTPMFEAFAKAFRHMEEDLQSNYATVNE